MFDFPDMSQYSSLVTDPDERSSWIGCYGWLCPEGMFYPCDYWEHEDFLRDHFKLSETEAEMFGWTRLRGSRVDYVRKPNPAQVEALIYLGYAVDEEKGYYGSPTCNRSNNQKNR